AHVHVLEIHSGDAESFHTRRRRRPRRPMTTGTVNIPPGGQVLIYDLPPATGEKRRRQQRRSTLQAKRHARRPGGPDQRALERRQRHLTTQRKFKISRIVGGKLIQYREIKRLAPRLLH